MDHIFPQSSGLASRGPFAEMLKRRLGRVRAHPKKGSCVISCGERYLCYAEHFWSEHFRGRGSSETDDRLLSVPHTHIFRFEMGCGFVRYEDAL